MQGLMCVCEKMRAKERRPPFSAPFEFLFHGHGLRRYIGNLIFELGKWRPVRRVQFCLPERDQGETGTTGTFVTGALPTQRATFH